MYITELILKNYKGIDDAKINFQKGLNVLIGKNSSGKSTVIDAISFLLSNYYQQRIENIRPYNKKNCLCEIHGLFKLSSKDISDILSFNEDTEYINEDFLKQIIVVYSKKISFKNSKSNLSQEIQLTDRNGNSWFPGDNRSINLVNILYRKIQSSSVVDLSLFENTSDQGFIPTDKITDITESQPNMFYSYFKSFVLKMKSEMFDKFQELKNIIVYTYGNIEDFDVEFDIKTGNVELYIIQKKETYKRSIENEGKGNKEFIYLVIAVVIFADRVMIMDEGLIHMHKKLIDVFLKYLKDQECQLITTSHNSDLITSLDFANTLFCRSIDGKKLINNLISMDNIDKIMDELGY